MTAYRCAAPRPDGWPCGTCAPCRAARAVHADFDGAYQAALNARGPARDAAWERMETRREAWREVVRECNRTEAT